MLNKRGELDNFVDYFIGVVFLVIGLIIIAQVTFSSSIDITERVEHFFYSETELLSFETKFIGTDLINILKLEVDEEYTFGEMLSYIPRNYPDQQDSFLFDGLLTQHFSDRMSCDEGLYDLLDENLSPVYGEKWLITLKDEDDELVFFCTPITFELISWPDYGEFTIPLQDTSKTAVVRLEVHV
jgi:hypothetical protein